MGAPTSFPGPLPWLGGGASQGKGPGNEVVGARDSVRQNRCRMQGIPGRNMSCWRP